MRSPPSPPRGVTGPRHERSRRRAGELARLERRAADAGIGEQLRILEDVAHDELPDLFRLADVVVSVPETDSFPVTLLEAMACGRPIVVSDLPAVTPVLRDVDPLTGE